MASAGGQLSLSIPSTWGGKRDNAGRPVAPGRRRTLHRVRPPHKPRHPVHVTMRARSEVGSLRSPRLFPAVLGALVAASRPAFRIVHFSVQRDHLHLIVEAHDKAALSGGATGLATRLARATNRALARKGSVWADRYHAHPLTTPREVRHALLYVLMNFRKHDQHDRRRMDPCSSAPWFDGFRQMVPHPTDPSPVWRATTWLLRKGWRRWGLIGIDEAPAARAPAPPRRSRDPAAWSE
jgi:putative transposase